MRIYLALLIMFCVVLVWSSFSEAVEGTVMIDGKKVYQDFKVKCDNGIQYILVPCNGKIWKKVRKDNNGKPMRCE